MPLQSRLPDRAMPVGTSCAPGPLRLPDRPVRNSETEGRRGRSWAGPLGDPKAPPHRDGGVRQPAATSGPRTHMSEFFLCRGGRSGGQVRGGVPRTFTTTLKTSREGLLAAHTAAVPSLRFATFQVQRRGDDGDGDRWRCHWKSPVRILHAGGSSVMVALSTTPRQRRGSVLLLRLSRPIKAHPEWGGTKKMRSKHRLP